jgi:hypothetical protein
MTLYDHVDLRVSDLARVRALYDLRLPAMGFSRIDEDGLTLILSRGRRSDAAILSIDDRSGARAHGTRIGFRATIRRRI